MGVPGDNGIREQAWDDRVARDLGIAYHEVGIEEYEEWQKKGFKAKKGDCDLEDTLRRNRRERSLEYRVDNKLFRDYSLNLETH
ncbi:MAG: hypothetical protein Q9161_008015 [Pseudevernia consocians]